MHAKLFCLTALLLLLVANSSAQSANDQTTKPNDEFSAQQREAAEQNPDDVTFTIQLAEGKRKFRQGEIIGLEMSFSSNATEKYDLDAATYDRSGRLHLDTFYLTPDTGVVDPLSAYFNNGLGFFGGGIRSIPRLGLKPYLVKLELNEWYRFDRPGQHRLYVASPRISLKNKWGTRSADQLIVTSNVIEFEIVPAEGAWQEQAFQKAARAIAVKEESDARRQACRVLRFLGTKAAAREMINRYSETDDTCSFQYYAGLLGSPRRDFVIEQMEVQLAAPTQAVSGSWLNLLTMLTAAAQQSLTRPAEGAPTQQWNAYVEEQRKLHEQVQSRLLPKLAAALPLKKGRARAVSAQTLIEAKFDPAGLPSVADILLDLPPTEQSGWLKYRWKRIASPTLLPSLRQLYQQPDQKNQARTELRTVALQRLYELNEAEGRRFILAEMQKPAPTVGLDALLSLPDETLLELDNAFLKNFELAEAHEIFSALIERYASASLLPEVSAYLTEHVGQLACYQQARLLAYMLRVNPDNGIEFVRQAIQARSKDSTRCYAGLLGEVGKLEWHSELEKLALELLDEPDAEVALDAVAVLGRYGSASVEPMLWKRLETWQQIWRGRANELNTSLAYENPLWFQRKLEEELINALIQSPAWLADAKRWQRLQQTCVSAEKKEELARGLQIWSKELAIEYAPTEETWGTVLVGHYRIDSLSALKDRLAQFPPGTSFKWRPSQYGAEDAKQQLQAELTVFLTAREMRLEQ